MAKYPCFEIFKGKDAQFYFHLCASNGEIILSSEGYTAKDNCRKGIESVLKHASEANNYELRQSTNGSHYFILKSTNHQIIGNSQMYSSAAACRNGVESVMRHALLAGVEERV